MNHEHPILGILIGLFISILLSAAFFWVEERIRSAAALRATGEEWERVSNGYVE
jgi:hypothetical protein